ncbi:60S ribosomal protein L37a-1 [Citrus sinensis]|uniref:60S ribosomal protein L37a-1 n=1 Tax=Citrus sinensis TaxID=2711 RepID=A0ACB8HUT8_CITSI|nr:60S ribosomal protein L37a-1 [Citrus sinensis]
MLLRQLCGGSWIIWRLLVLIEMIELINKVVSVHEDESVLMLIESPDTVGTCYGANLKKMEYAVRKAVGIWGCKDSSKVKAGGAYTLNIGSAVTARGTIRRLREQTES